MTVKDLKDILNRTERYDDSEVVVKTNNQSVGRISHSVIRGANNGFDWEKDMFILWPSDDLIKIKNNTNETKL